MLDDPLDVSTQGFTGKPSFASLLEGLIRDIKTLVRQEITLAKDEIQAEVRKLKMAGLSVIIGTALAAVGGLLLIFMLVHLLQAVTGLPLWACYGIVGGLLVGSAALLLFKAKANMSDVHLAPQQTLAAMKENATWIKEQVASHKT
jgi:hypothetical protein